MAGNGAYTSDAFTPTAAGTYRWIANYGGDANNSPTANACNAANESSVVDKLSPTVATQASGPVTLGAAISDTATLAGATTNPAATGTITFTLFGPDNATCTGTPIFTNAKPVSRQRGLHLGRLHPHGRRHLPLDRQLRRGRQQQPHGQRLQRGQRVEPREGGPDARHDPQPGHGHGRRRAQRHGGARRRDGQPDGHDRLPPVRPRRRRPAPAPPVFTQTVPVSGNGTYSTGTPPVGHATTQAGTYHWTADYSGDPNNDPAASPCVAEAVVVAAADAALGTTPNPATGTVGAVLNDSAALVGGSNPTGTIVFRLFAPGDADCTGAAPVFTQTVPVSGNGTYSTTVGHATTQAGTYHWTADYSGDPNNDPAASPCLAEAVVVNKAGPTLGTTPNPATGTVGAVLNDSAALAGATANAGGTIVFRLFAPGDPTCTGAAVFTQTVPVSGNGTYSTGTPPVGHATTQAGTYHWTADYSGDPNNDPAASPCLAEAVVVGKSSPAITTLLLAPAPRIAGGAPTVAVGASVTDSATLTDATPDAGGSVTYTVYSNNTCTANPRAAGTVTVANGVVPNSDAVPFPAAGDFYWQAAYSGDANNGQATSLCTAEHLVVGKAAPTITTTLSAESVVVGASVTDSATLSGATPDAGGSVTYTVYSNNTCTANPRAAGTVTVANGVVPNSDAVPFPSRGGLLLAGGLLRRRQQRPGHQFLHRRAPGGGQELARHHHPPLGARAQDRRGRAHRGGRRQRHRLGHAHRRDARRRGQRHLHRLQQQHLHREPAGGRDRDGGQRGRAQLGRGALPRRGGLLLAGGLLRGRQQRRRPQPLQQRAPGGGQELARHHHPPLGARAQDRRGRAHRGGRGQRRPTRPRSPGRRPTPGARSPTPSTPTPPASVPFQPAGVKTVANGVVPNSDAVPFPAAGDFYWQAAYSGDANNGAALSLCSSEHLVVGKSSPAITTLLLAPAPRIAGGAPTVAVGASVTDSATLSGATPDAGGTVTYTVYSNNTCTANPRARRDRDGRPTGSCPTRTRCPSPARGTSTGRRPTPGTPTTARPPASAAASTWWWARPPPPSPRPSRRRAWRSAPA